MATLKISVDDSSQKFDAHLDAVSEVVDDMLDAAGEIVVNAWKAEANSRPHRRSGTMIDKTEAKAGLRKPDEYRCIKIYPRDNDPEKPPKKFLYGSGHEKRQVTNAVKAFLLNYGTVRDGKVRIHGDHWVERTREYSDPKALSEMDRIWKKFCETF